MSLEPITLPDLPVRDPAAHKGTFGTVGVVGGQGSEQVMIGSAALVALAALRSGCGLATVAAPETIIHSVIEVAFEATDAWRDVWEGVQGSWNASRVPRNCSDAADAYDPSLIIDCGDGKIPEAAALARGAARRNASGAYVRG